VAPGVNRTGKAAGGTHACVVSMQHCETWHRRKGEQSQVALSHGRAEVEKKAPMKRLWQLTLILVVLIAIGITGLYFYLPVKRVDVTSDLIMLGDLNGDRKWDGKDETRLTAVLAKPFQCDTVLIQLIDVNRNDAIDPEDLAILERLYRFSAPDGICVSTGFYLASRGLRKITP